MIVVICCGEPINLGDLEISLFNSMDEATDFVLKRCEEQGLKDSEKLITCLIGARIIKNYKRIWAIRIYEID